MTPKKIGRYQILYEVGRGGMATVYRAHDPRFDRDVAIKVLPREFLHDPTFRSRFEHEAKTIATLEHSAIVPVYDFGEEKDQPYLVMRYMTGGSLAERIENGPMSVSESARILERIGSALDYAHSQGIIHRDLKPRNILFDQFDDAFLADFGIAKMTQGSAALTGSTIIGTPVYVSPEQASGERTLDGRSDIYALGTILFEMLTGQQPFQADTPMALAFKHVHEPVPRVLDSRPDLPPDCELVIDRAMAKDRDERFSTASEMVGNLAAVARGEKVSLTPIPSPALAAPVGTQQAGAATYPSPSTRPRSKWILMAGVAMLLLMAGGIIGLSDILGNNAQTAPPATTIPVFAPAVATTTRSATPAPAKTLAPSDTPSPTPTAPTPTPVPTWTSTQTRTPTRTRLGSTPTRVLVATTIPTCILDVELVEVRDPWSYWYVGSRPSFTLVLRNVGTCPWPDGTELILVSDNTLGWPESWPVDSVDTDREIEIAIQLIAPMDRQTFSIVWELQGPAGESIGSELTRTLRIEPRPIATEIPAPPAISTATPQPGQPEPPPGPPGNDTPRPPSLPTEPPETTKPSQPTEPAL